MKSVRFGSQDASTSPIDIGPGSRPLLEITVASGAGSISGVVQNDKGEPQIDTLVTLAPTNPELARVPELFRTTRTNGQGQFTFPNLRPGEYQVLAWEDADPDLVAIADFRQLFGGTSGVRVDVNAHPSIQLAPIPSTSVEAEAIKIR